jgi:hypothetical protein
MDRVEVESSNIASIGYDPASMILEIEFKGKFRNTVYQYPGVPESLHQALMAAESKGQYFGQNIKPFYGFIKQE